MNFVTTSFVLFFLPVLLIGWCLRAHCTLYKYFLIAAGLYFYSQVGVEYLLLLLTIAFINWGSVRLMFRCRSGAKKRLITAADVSIHILLLLFYKYAEPFFLWLNDVLGAESQIQQWLAESGMGDVVLPAGLSFYSFQGISYLVDHYRNPERTPHGFTDVLAYISFFPTLLAGPIMRSHEFFPQLAAYRQDTRDFNEGMALILSGLFKKVVLATYLSRELVDPFFRDPEAYCSATALIGVYAYAIQIFLDFSGYSDMAIGIGRLMGFHIPQNFNSPYRALNLQEFWHRWHITLSQWLRDYLYIPLGGNRRGNRYVNLTITMLIGGIWHGSGLNFLIWGFFHGIGLAVVHAFGQLKKRFRAGKEPMGGIMGGLYKIIAWLLTFHFICLLWIFFRAEDFESAKRILNIIANGQPGDGCTPQIFIIIAAGLALQWCGGPCMRVFTAIQSKLPWPVQAVVVAFLGGVILNLGPEGVLPFIYFDF